MSAKVYPFVKEVHYRINDKNLYAIGFENISGGWELRNAFYKGALLRKDISIIKDAEISNLNPEKIQNFQPDKVSVFEGFMDALSFIEMSEKATGDLLVMNSIALLTKTKNHLENYSEIDLFLNNDRAGKFCTDSILKSKDRSEIYSPHKDLNEFLLSKTENNLEINFVSNLSEVTERMSESEQLEIKNESIYKRRR